MEMLSRAWHFHRERRESALTTNHRPLTTVLWGKTMKSFHHRIFSTYLEYAMKARRTVLLAAGLAAAVSVLCFTNPAWSGRLHLGRQRERDGL